MGCIWCKTPNRCLVCNSKEPRGSSFINNRCRACLVSVQSRHLNTIPYRLYSVEHTSIPSPNRSTVNEVFTRQKVSAQSIKPQLGGYTSIPSPNRTNVRGVLPQPRLSDTSNKPQFGEYYCKSCGRSWNSLRSWSTKYQMCKRCKKPVYPQHLRQLLSSDYTSTIEDSKEHERELCQMCKQLGYACKDYRKSTKNKNQNN